MNECWAVGLAEFLQTYPGMDVYPVRDAELRLEGLFEFSAESKEHGQVSDTFRLRIIVPETFPKDLPIVHELSGRIPREGKYHINPSDGSLCLGSRLRLLVSLSQKPTIADFASNCLIPYLFAVALKLHQGGRFAFGELAHGSPGEIADYIDLFGLRTAAQAIEAIRCLGIRKRRANKLLCPCECGSRLGACSFNRRMKRYRQIAERRWYRDLASDLLNDTSTGSMFRSAVRTVLRNKQRDRNK